MSRLWLTLIAFTGVFSLATAQQATVTLDPDTFQIGEPASLTLRLSFTGVDRNEIFWAAFGDTLAPEVEVLDRGGVDTVQSLSGYDLTLQQNLSITCWDSGYKAIPPFFFLVAGDTISTGFTYIECTAPEVNLAESYKDIKDIYEDPFTWSEWLAKYWPWLLAALVVCSTLLWWLLKMRKKKTATATMAAPVPSVPPHELAMQQLLQLEKTNRWQSGDIKGYYSELSDILRTYIEDQFRIPALEETTARTLQYASTSGIDSEQINMLGRILREADMVKFAKHHPGEFTHGELMRVAKEFVTQSHHLQPAQA
ncbi:MAG: hypothetical protein JNM00_04250 [Flavobacteriales bacterium]|nr:hypothetical protein [Flavobacteriales bacterium]